MIRAPYIQTVSSRKEYNTGVCVIEKQGIVNDKFVQRVTDSIVSLTTVRRVAVHWSHNYKRVTPDSMYSQVGNQEQTDDPYYLKHLV